MKDDLTNQSIEVGIELLEAFCDQILDDGLLKEIPILGTAIKIAKIRDTISDRIFFNKVKKFITSLPTINDTEKQKFCDQIISDPKSAQKTGEILVLILNSFNDFEKPAILAKIFAAFVREQISFKEFRRLAHAVEISYTEDLNELMKLSDKHSILRIIFM